MLDFIKNISLQIVAVIVLIAVLIALFHAIEWLLPSPVDTFWRAS